jgi:hypothetical protein
MYALERAKILAAELDRILEEVRRAPSITAAETMRPCRLYWAACEAAEAARILETHRRRMELAPEEFEALERYGRIYERASLILLEHFPIRTHSHRRRSSSRGGHADFARRS